LIFPQPVRRKIHPRENPLQTVPDAWSDEDFREAFESLKILNEMFHHREHIRLA